MTGSPNFSKTRHTLKVDTDLYSKIKKNGTLNFNILNRLFFFFFSLLTIYQSILFRFGTSSSYSKKEIDTIQQSKRIPSPNSYMFCSLRSTISDNRRDLDIIKHVLIVCLFGLSACIFLLRLSSSRNGKTLGKSQQHTNIITGSTPI